MPLTCLGRHIFVAAAIVAGGCESPIGSESAPLSHNTPVLTFSSAKLGDVAHGAGIKPLKVAVRNAMPDDVSVSRWAVSCDCLSIEPPRLVISARGETSIELMFDPDKEGDKFIGDLLISVEAFAGDELVGQFSVPVSVVAAESVEP